MAVKSTQDKVVTALEEMAVEFGSKVGNYFVANFSVKDVLERVGNPNTDANQNYVRYKVHQLYPKSKIILGQGDNGGFVCLKIWSK